MLWVLAMPSIAWPTESERSLENARAQLSRGDYDGALRQAKDFLLENPRDAGALYVAGVASLNLDRLNDAERYFEKALRAAPDAPNVEYQLGVVLLRMADGFFARGKDKIGTGLCDEAVEHLENELRRSPDHAEAISLRAEAYVKAGRADQATRAYEEWVSTNPDDPEVFLALVSLYTAQDRTDDARKLLGRFPEGQAQLGEATFLVARSDYIEGRITNGRVLLEQLRHLPSEPWQIPGLEALDALARGQGHEAAASLLAFIEHDPPAQHLEAVVAAYHEQYMEMRRSQGEADPSNASHTLPKLDLRVSHKYPLDADRYGVEGEVLLLVIVAEDGSVAKLSVVSTKVSRHESLYRSKFEEAAREAVEQWRYVPARRDGKAVAFPVTVNVRFSQ